MFSDGPRVYTGQAINKPCMIIRKVLDSEKRIVDYKLTSDLINKLIVCVLSLLAQL